MFNGILMNQVGTDAERDRSRADVISRGLLVHAAGSDQRNLREGCLERAYVSGAADWRARKAGVYSD